MISYFIEEVKFFINKYNNSGFSIKSCYSVIVSNIISILWFNDSVSTLDDT